MGRAGRVIVVEMVAHRGQDSQAGLDRQVRAKMAAVRPGPFDPVRVGPGDAVRALARSGLMALTGWPDRAPVLPPLGLPAALAGVVAEIEGRTRALGRPVRVDWGAALAGRAALLGLHRRGRTSANGTCRLLPTEDGWVALNLPRPDDLELLPALTGRTVTDPWPDLMSAAAGCSTDAFLEQARLLGLAASAVRGADAGDGPGLSAPPRPVPAHARHGPAATIGPVHTWQVVDLSSLWAGPVTARVLAEAGARVTKIESEARPDAARAQPAFYGWVHRPGEAAVRLDFRASAGRAQVSDLIDGADVVIEASRPRALQQLGLGPDDRPERPGRVWLSITGHGRQAPGRDWVAFGDDAAVAGGLVGWDAHQEPVFCGDAIADPITGLIGAAAVLAALEAGGGVLIDLAMSRAAASAAARAGGSPPPVEVESVGAAGWAVRAGDRVEEVRARPARLDWIEAG
jgi:hypothetical protein